MEAGHGRQEGREDPAGSGVLRQHLSPPGAGPRGAGRVLHDLGPLRDRQHPGRQVGGHHEPGNAQGRVVDEGRRQREDLDRHRARLVSDPVRHDAALASQGRPESVLRDLPDHAGALPEEGPDLPPASLLHGPGPRLLALSPEPQLHGPAGLRVRADHHADHDRRGLCRLQRILRDRAPPDGGQDHRRVAPKEARMDAVFRTCAQTGLKVHNQAERLIRANAVAGVFAILFGGIAAVLVLLTRWPAVHLLDPTSFYRALTFHGINMLIFWIIFFEIAVLYFAGPIVLGSRVAWPRIGWGAFALMVAGSLLIDVAILAGKADVMMTSYAPLQAVSYFYLSWILFAVGALVSVCNFFATLVIARAERTYEGSIPLVTFGAATAAIIAVVTLAHGAIIYIPTWLWSLGIISYMDAGIYRLVWWGLGHSSQQINVAAMVTIWYLLATLTVGATPINEKVSRSAFLLYILFINLASAHHLLVDPQGSPAWKIWNTGYGMYLAVLASMVHGMTVPASVEVAQRRHGLSKGLFEWLAKAPWGNPGFAALALSIVLFGFIGGITGVTFGAEQVNIISHNTLRITGHFHATVVAGTTIAFMGLTYFVVPLIFRRQ